MAKNQVYARATQFPVPVPAGVASGDPVVVGTVVGVALNSRQDDGTVTVKTDGAHTFTVTGAITWGAAVYAVVSSGLVTGLTATASGNTYFGQALGAQAATGLLTVKLPG